MEQTTEPLWQSLLISWLPLIILLGFFTIIFRRYSMSSKSKYGRLIDRSFEHYDRIEEKLDRVIELIERKGS